jgi:GTPase SAR1 family protein
MRTYVYKVVLLGNHGVGKTTLFKKLKGEIEVEVLYNRNTSSFSESTSINLDPCTLEFRIKDKPDRIMVSFN